jgi:hypothetical protein
LVTPQGRPERERDSQQRSQRQRLTGFEPAPPNRHKNRNRQKTSDAKTFNHVNIDDPPDIRIEFGLLGSEIEFATH